MAIEEQELRQRLEEVAGHVSAPGFRIDGVIGRIRRRRARIIGAAWGSLLVVAAIAVAIPIALSSAGKPPMTMPPGKLPVRLSFTVMVNGEPQVLPKTAAAPRFVVTAGSKLRINVNVTVPAHAAVAEIWLGLAGDSFGVNGAGPIGVRPILAHTTRSLAPGLHTFKLQWAVPAGLRRVTSLVATWKAGDSTVGQTIAELVLLRGPNGQASATPGSRP